MLDRNKHGVFNKEINNKWWNVFKIIFRGMLLMIVLFLSSYGMYQGGEFSDIAFCIWCLTLIQLTEL